jgi:acetylornithine/succinyldiaminopimelate/putrescine aminotransferase
MNEPVVTTNYLSAIDSILDKIYDVDVQEVKKLKEERRNREEIKVIRGNCKYCGIELNRDNVSISKKGYLASGRVCNACRNKLYKFYIAKPFLINFMKKLSINNAKIMSIIETEKILYIRKGDESKETKKKIRNTECPI